MVDGGLQIFGDNFDGGRIGTPSIRDDGERVGQDFDPLDSELKHSGRCYGGAGGGEDLSDDGSGDRIEDREEVPPLSLGSEVGFIDNPDGRDGEGQSGEEGMEQGSGDVDVVEDRLLGDGQEEEALEAGGDLTQREAKADGEGDGQDEDRRGEV